MEIAYNGSRKRVQAAAGIPVMIREIYTTYHLPVMPKELTLADDHFWYDPLIPELVKMQNENKKNKKVKK